MSAIPGPPQFELSTNFSSKHGCPRIFEIHFRTNSKSAIIGEGQKPDEEILNMVQIGDSPLDAYRELDRGESISCETSGGHPCVVELQDVDDRSAAVRVNDAVAEIPLGHFTKRTVSNPPGDVVNVMEMEGLRIGADLTRNYMSGSKYSLSLVNLQKDARILLRSADKPLSSPGNHVFPVSDYEWNFGENWLQPVIYGWHLGIDIDAERGHPLVAVTDGSVLAIRHFDAAHEPDDYWGNGLALLGDDGLVYIYMHWDELRDGLVEGSRVRAGDEIGPMGRSGFDSKDRITTHLHFEVMVLRHPEKFRFTFEVEPEVLPTPNRILLTETEGYVVNPYPYLVEWYMGAKETAG